MGETAENVAVRFGVSREDQDAFALRSQRRWADAQAAGRFDDELVPVGDVVVDEHPRPDTTAEKLATLRAAFRDGRYRDGRQLRAASTTARPRSWSPPRRRPRELGADPLGTFVGSAAAGVDPRLMGIGPIPAVRQLLERTGVRIEDVDLVELNEAFASQSLAVIRELGIDPERVNVNGGAIALGPSARDERCAPRRDAAARAPPPGRPLRPRDAVRRRRSGPGRPVRAVRT